MPKRPPEGKSSQYILRTADLPARTPYRFDIEPTAPERAEIQASLELDGLRKVRFYGELAPLGKTDWRLTAALGATVIQPCVATLEPVTTRIETEVSRQFLAGYEEPEAPEVEMPEDDSVEALGSAIDLWQVLVEALSLAVPLYPRADQHAEAVELRVTEPGKHAMTDEEAKPFAGLAALKSQLAPPEGSD